MSLSDLFMPIIPRHQRLLERLIAQRQIDRYGSIGWKGLMDEDEAFTVDQLFKPLVERGLVEDLTGELGHSGSYFVHITKLGMICQGLGVMLKEPRIVTAHEVKKYLTPLFPPPRPTDAWNTIQAEQRKAERTSGANPHDPNEEKEAIA